MSIANAVKEENYAKTLAELDITSEIAIKVIRKTNDLMGKQAIIAKNGKLVPKAEAAFEEIFELFSDKGKIQPESIASFLNICNNAYWPKIDTKPVEETATKTLNEFDKEKKGYMVKGEFMECVAKMAKENEKSVWGMFFMSGYNTALEKFRTAEEFAAECRAKAQRLPRYLLSNNAKHLNFLFTLLRTLS